MIRFLFFRIQIIIPILLMAVNLLGKIAWEYQSWRCLKTKTTRCYSLDWYRISWPLHVHSQGYDLWQLHSSAGTSLAYLFNRHGSLTANIKTTYDISLDSQISLLTPGSSLQSIGNSLMFILYPSSGNTRKEECW